MTLMRAVNLFLFFILIISSLPSYSQELSQYFLKPSDKNGNSLTRYFRTHTAILHDSNPCEDRTFYGHLTTPAHTLPGNKFAYQPFPGARFDTFLMNSLSLGLWEGIQIGTVPAFYLMNESRENPTEDYSKHISNFNLKWTLWSFKNLDVAMAWSFLSLRTYFASPLIMPSGVYNDARINFTWTSLVLNYYFENLPLGLGVNLSSVYIGSDNKDLDREFRKKNTNSEYIIDLNYVLNPTWAVTVGGGKIKETAFELEKAYYSYGTSFTYTRNTKWFNEITMGVHHFNTINTTKFLFSFSI